MKALANLLHRIPTKLFIVLTISLSYLPFLNFRILRMAGDEKVYLSQAIEMIRVKHWFIQTLADEPSYFKGPLHYIAIHLGYLVFGNQLIAGLWMNYAFALLLAWFMFELGKRHWDEKAGLFLAIASALNIGVYSHAFVSQMEIEVTALYGLSMIALFFNKDIWFWVIAGICGWSKSPLHSVLLAISAFSYWTWSGLLLKKIKTSKFWLSAFLGIFVGILGYLPALTLDFQNFYQTYILREQFQKANNNRQWTYVVFPLFHFLLPWSLLLFNSLKNLISTFFRSKSFLRVFQNTIDYPMLRLSVSFIVPTVLFWCFWTYKGQNYNLPVLPAILVFIVACEKKSPNTILLKITGFLVFTLMVLASLSLAHFWPLPSWWSINWLLLTLVSFLIFLILFLLANEIRLLALGAVAFFICFASIVTPLGEREMIDARQFLAINPYKQIYYNNLDPSIWSEWSILQFTLHHEIFGLHQKDQLKTIMKPNNVLVVQDSQWVDYVLNEFKKQKYGTTPKITPWRRWMTKGKSSSGQSQWGVAWKSADLSFLEREFYFIEF